LDYKTFIRLLKEGEKENVDFKIDCKAFTTKSEKKYRGELAKDICAMANNGRKKSYIIIGVSDDRKHFKSFENPDFTDDKLQDFCKKAIFPIPSVKFSLVQWNKGNPDIANKKFGIIEIGPHKRTAYHINQDFIDYEHKFCIRRNEVWVRRGATSDLATPEEIARLLEGKAPTESIDIEENIEYQLLPESKKTDALFKDFAELIETVGGKIKKANDKKKFLVLRIRDIPFVLSVIITHSLNSKYSWWENIAHYWSYEHGLIFLLFDKAREYAFPENILNMRLFHIKKPWGWFTAVAFPNAFVPDPRVLVPNTVENSAIFALTIKGIKKTSHLHNNVMQAIEFLNDNDSIFEELKRRRDNHNEGLKEWLSKTKEECQYYWAWNQWVDSRELKKYKSLAKKILEFSEF